MDHLILTNRHYVFWLGSCFFLLPVAMQAAPILTTDRNPLIAGSLPLLPEATLPPIGEYKIDLLFGISNTIHIESDKSGSEHLILDAETSTVDVHVIRRINQRWFAGLHVPLVHYGRGELDGFLDDYHKTLGLPRGDRPTEPEDRFLIRYEIDDKMQLELEQSSSGIGDISILSGFSVRETSDQHLTVYSRLKFPSGDHRRLAGSGRADLAGWFASVWRPEQVVRLSADFGLVAAVSDGKAVQNQESIIWYGSGGVEWQVNDRLVLKSQLDAHSSIFKNSNLDLLNSVVLLTMGGTLDLKPELQLNISVSEDIQVGASPDVSLQIGFTFLPH